MTVMPSLRTILACLALLAAPAASATACASSQDAETDNPTFAKTIEPLIQARCQGCHNPDGIAPFSLVTYEEVKAMGEAAKVKVVAREMPPWGALSDDSCKMKHKLRDDLSLTDDEIAKFAKWVDTGMPLGDASSRPAPRTMSATPGLTGNVTTYAMKDAREVLGGGQDDIRCFPIDPGFAKDTWVNGWNVAPGDKRVVHHAIVFVDASRSSLAKADASGSYPCFGGPGTSGIPSLLLAWAPGVPAADLGADIGVKIPANAALVLQVHYHPFHQTVMDKTGFELRMLDTKPSFVAQTLLLGNATSASGIIRLLPGPNDPAEGPKFLIPANASGHTETMEVTIPEKLGGFNIPDLSILASGAHMHWAGKDMKVEITRKAPVEDQPEKECLLSAPRYNFNWQRGYAYDAPMEKLPSLKPGDTLRFTCTYDNTTDNPGIRKALAESRVAAPKDIPLGESTLEEMCLGAITTVRPASLID